MYGAWRNPNRDMVRAENRSRMDSRRQQLVSDSLPAERQLVAPVSHRPSANARLIGLPPNKQVVSGPRPNDALADLHKRARSPPPSVLLDHKAIARRRSPDVVVSYERISPGVFRLQSMGEAPPGSYNQVRPDLFYSPASCDKFPHFPFATKYESSTVVLPEGSGWQFSKRERNKLRSSAVTRGLQLDAVLLLGGGGELILPAHEFRELGLGSRGGAVAAGVTIPVEKMGKVSAKYQYWDAQGEGLRPGVKQELVDRTALTRRGRQFAPIAQFAPDIDAVLHSRPSDDHLIDRDETGGQRWQNAQEAVELSRAFEVEETFARALLGARTSPSDLFPTVVWAICEEWSAHQWRTLLQQFPPGLEVGWNITEFRISTSSSSMGRQLVRTKNRSKTSNERNELWGEGGDGGRRG